MSVKKEYRDQGVGRALLKSLIQWAETDPLIEKIRLEVFSTNHRAISLYTSLDFTEEGRLVKQIKMNDKSYIDLVLMSKFLKQ